MPSDRKPTIHELEAILDAPPGRINVEPDGQVRAHGDLPTAALVEALEDLIGLAEAAMRRCGEYDVDGELADARAAISAYRAQQAGGSAGEPSDGAILSWLLAEGQDDDADNYIIVRCDDGSENSPQDRGELIRAYDRAMCATAGQGEGE